ncbi:MAG TPA: hypothetical protein VF950_19040, partial [Planctomycetota bacterium]
MNQRTARVVSAFAVLALLAGIGCGTSSSSTAAKEAPPADPLVTQEPVKPDAAAEAAEKKAPTIQATPEFEKIAQELVKGRTAQEQQKIYESQQHYDMALRYHNRGEFEKAKIEAQKAVQAWHENLEARKLLTDINQVTVGGRAEFGARAIAEDARDEFRVRIEQAQIEITKNVRDGERYLNARMYEKAIKEFEDAEFKIRNIPYDVKAMNDLLPLVKESIVKAKNARTLEDNRVEEQKRKEAESEAIANELATKREVT